MCRGQTDRAGLGYKKTQKLIKDMKPREHRQSLTSLVKDVDEDDMVVYLYGCTKQGQWLKWKSVMQVDTSWKKLLYVWTPELLSFHFNAIHDQLPSPANLRLWGKTNLGSCHLCHHSNCTLFHILNGCNYSLQSGRYNWRHDQTLKTITSGLMTFIDLANERQYGTQDRDYIPTIAFRTADGTAYRNPAIPLQKNECTNILQKANDWEVLMDEEHKQIVFPPQIAETAKRPDIIIYSERTRTVIIIELTVPMEENLANAYARKKCKYQDLVAECENRGWCTHYFPIEIGSRGFYNTSLSKCLAALGVPSGKRKTIMDTASKTALRASYVIWLCRQNKSFNQMDLTTSNRVQAEKRD